MSAPTNCWPIWKVNNMTRRIYPLTTDDMAIAASRPGDIPIREDVTLCDGRIIRKMLCYGSPKYYSIQVRDGKFYGAPAPHTGDAWEPAHD